MAEASGTDALVAGICTLVFSVIVGLILGVLISFIEGTL